MQRYYYIIKWAVVLAVFASVWRIAPWPQAPLSLARMQTGERLGTPASFGSTGVAAVCPRRAREDLSTARMASSLARRPPRRKPPCDGGG